MFLYQGLVASKIFSYNQLIMVKKPENCDQSGLELITTSDFAGLVKHKSSAIIRVC